MIDLYNSRFHDLLPPNLQNAHTESLSYAVDRQHRDFVAYIPRVIILADVMKLGESLCDFLALVMAIEAYSFEFDLDTKRRLIAVALKNTSKSGTAFAVQEVLTIIHGNAEVLEWNTYGGKPFHFRIRLIDSIDPDRKNAYRTAINYTKRLSAWLDAIEILILWSFYNQNRFVPVRLIMRSSASNYAPTPAIFNGEYNFDGAITFDQRIGDRFHLVKFGVFHCFQEKSRGMVSFRHHGSFHNKNTLDNSRLIISTAFHYPRLLFDGRACFDGNSYFTGTPQLERGHGLRVQFQNMRIKAQSQNRSGSSGQLIRNTMHTFEGENAFDGQRNFNAAIAKEEL